MSHKQLMLPVQFAKELTFCDAGTRCDWPEFTAFGVAGVVENRHTGQQKRWTSVHELVLRDADGFLWRRLYERGLTERQIDYMDASDTFGGEGDTIPFDMVQRKTVEAFEYVPLSLG